MLESHAVFFIQAYAASFFLGQTSPLLHGAAFFTLLCFFAHPRSKFANQTLWSTKDFVKLLFSGHHAHSMVMHVNIMAWHYIGTLTFMLATGLPFDTIWRADLALDVRVLCGKQPSTGLGQSSLQHAPPAPDKSQGGLQSRAASARSQIPCGLHPPDFTFPPRRSSSPSTSQCSCTPASSTAASSRRTTATSETISPSSSAPRCPAASCAASPARPAR